MQGKVEIAGVNTAKLKVLKSSETMELLRRSKAGDRQAREELIEGNLRLEAYILDSYSTVARLNIYVWIAVEFILMLLELFLFLVMVRKTVHKPIQKLLCAFDRLSGGDTMVCISHDGNNEFTRLYTHFNRMVAQLNDLFTRRHQAELAARNAELKHLQQQIHPHFLYNSFY